jgi:hypothetical protein
LTLGVLERQRDSVDGRDGQVSPRLVRLTSKVLLSEDGRKWIVVVHGVRVGRRQSSDSKIPTFHRQFDLRILLLVAQGLYRV